MNKGSGNERSDRPRRGASSGQSIDGIESTTGRRRRAGSREESRRRPLTRPVREQAAPLRAPGKRRSPEIQAYIKGLNGNKRTAEKTFWTMASVKQQLIPELIREVDSDERTNLETVRRIGRISCVAEVRPF